MSDVSSTSDRPEETLVLKLTSDASGERLDVVVVEYLPQYSRTQIQDWIKAGCVLVEGGQQKAAYRVQAGETISIDIPPERQLSVEPESIPLSVIYDDDDLVAIDKPAGMVVHPATGHHSGTLVNAVLARWPQMREVGGVERAGIVHRLDKDTSGVILLAKSVQAMRVLQRQFKNREVQKRYLALVEGVPESSEGIINAPLGRDPKRRKRMAVISGGREAVSRYKLLEAFDQNALLEVYPLTGRTHQIRVHLAWFGHPIVGDEVYGYRRQRIALNRHWLHAASLKVRSPSSEALLTFEAPLPHALQQILDQLGDRAT